MLHQNNVDKDFIEIEDKPIDDDQSQNENRYYNFDDDQEFFIQGNELSQQMYGSFDKTSFNEEAEKNNDSENSADEITDIVIRGLSTENRPSNPFQFDVKKNEDLSMNSKEMGQIYKGKVNCSTFNFIYQVGMGAFGKVYKVQHKYTKEIFALKALNKKQLILNKQLRYAITEANILRNNNHPFILKLHYSFQTPNHLYMAMDYCSGHDLSVIIARCGILQEDIAKFYFAEILLAIEELHNLNIIYRDMKPENILIFKDGHIKLADFGLAKQNVDSNDIAKSFCGSPAYLSPEMLTKKGVTKSSDIYGIGTVLYEMLTGNPPFFSNDIQSLYESIENSQLTFPFQISKKSKDLLEKLLHKDPNKRIGCKDKTEIKKHPFFEGINWEKLYNKEYKAPEIEIEEEDVNIKDNKFLQINDQDYTEQNKNLNRIPYFSFSKDEPDSNNQ